MVIDPVVLTTRLVRCRSETPEEGGALRLLEEELTAADFSCVRVDRGGVANLFARWGPRGHGRTMGFNGHTDVVPAGDAASWTMPPFGGEISDGWLYGRGACDMKSGVAAFAAAAVDFLRVNRPDGAVVLAITGDEEGDACDGTAALLDFMETSGERMSVCLVGEPTCPDRLGDTIKVGRRGSLTARFVALGVQGHSAYPHRAKNPLTALVRLFDRLVSRELDPGTEHFEPSTLALVGFDTENKASNVIPARCSGTINIRFNDAHTGVDLCDWLRHESARVAEELDIKIEVDTEISGESFLSPPGDWPVLVARAVEAETGVKPVFSTSGGTSDARFVKDHCPVVEFGLVGQTMHQVDERVEIAQIHQLKAVYGRILRAYFA